MAKVAVAVRLSPETVELVDAQAKARGVSRQVVLESAVASFLDDCRRGVPDLVPERVRPVTPQGPIVPSLLGLRQKALNEAKERASR